MARAVNKALLLGACGIGCVFEAADGGSAVPCWRGGGLGIERNLAWTESVIHYDDKEL